MMVHFTKDQHKKVFHMGRVYKFGVMVINIREILIMGNFMIRERFKNLMVPSILDSFKMDKNMVKEKIYGLIIDYMKAIGKMIN
jgi:hypothetical protein